MRPVVGITCCYQQQGEVGADCVQRKYIDAVAQAAECLPLLLPTLGAALDVDALFTAVDGLLFTGSPSNVQPQHYAGPQSRPDVRHDPRRDATTLPLLRCAVAEGVPVLALCRGHQELNVAFGGSLHQHVQELPGKLDHREDETVPEALRYEPAHEVMLAPDGLLARLYGTDRLRVNSLHGQGIDRLAPGLAVEATAPDGLIEAVRVAEARRFAVGVQWHPEWEAAQRPESRLLFQAFAEACQARRRERLRTPPDPPVPRPAAAAPR